MNHWLNEIVLGLLLVFLLLCCKQTPGRRFYKGVKQRKSDCRLNTFVHRKKPQWVTDKVIYLKAVNPDFGCRKIAYTFNRLYQDKNESVSKSFVYDKLKQHQYQILLLRRKIKHQRPVTLPKNQKWGMDLTTVTDSTSAQNQVLAIIDYGTRKCLCLQTLESQHAISIIRGAVQSH